MNIIVPEDKNVPYVVFDARDIFEPNEVGDIFFSKEEKKLIKMNHNKFDIDNFVFIVPKIHLMPDEFKTDDITLERFTKLLSICDLLELPYFQGMKKTAREQIEKISSLDSETDDIDLTLIIMAERLKNLSKSHSRNVIVLPKNQRDIELDVNLWSSSMQSIRVNVVDENPVFHNAKFEGYQNRVQTMQEKQKNIEITYSGLSPVKTLIKMPDDIERNR